MNDNVINACIPYKYKGPIEVTWHYEDGIDWIMNQLIEEDVIAINIIGENLGTKDGLFTKIIPACRENQIILRIQLSSELLSVEQIKCLVDNNIAIDIALYDFESNNFCNLEQTISELNKLNYPVRLLYYINNNNWTLLDSLINFMKRYKNIILFRGILDNIKGIFGTEYNIEFKAHQRIIKLMTDVEQKTKECHYEVIDLLSFFRKRLMDKRANSVIYIDQHSDVMICMGIPIVYGNLVTNKLNEVWCKGLDNCWRDSNLEEWLNSFRSPLKKQDMNSVNEIEQKHKYEEIKEAIAYNNGVKNG